MDITIEKSNQNTKENKRNLNLNDIISHFNILHESIFRQNEISCHFRKWLLI